MNSECTDETVKLLSLCGQIAEHESAMMKVHNISDKALLGVIKPQEREELKGILEKLYSKWQEIHEMQKNK